MNLWYNYLRSGHKISRQPKHLFLHQPFDSGVEIHSGDGAMASVQEKPTLLEGPPLRSPVPLCQKNGLMVIHINCNRNPSLPLIPLTLRIPLPYSFVRIDIAINAFRPNISRNLPDMSKY